MSCLLGLKETRPYRPDIALFDYIVRVHRNTFVLDCHREPNMLRIPLSREIYLDVGRNAIISTPSSLSVVTDQSDILFGTEDQNAQHSNQKNQYIPNPDLISRSISLVFSLQSRGSFWKRPVVKLTGL